MGNPQTYFYTAFQGPAFLEAWARSRQEALAALPEPAPEAPPPDPHPSGTARFLETAFREALAAPGERTPLPFHAEALLRKFEVGKRVYDQYDDDLRPVSRDAFRTHAYYVRAGEVFEAALARTGDLRALNVLLKCLDTLTAHRRELPADLAGRVARLIARERQLVSALAHQKGVDLP